MDEIKIVKIGHPALRTVSSKVEDFQSDQVRDTIQLLSKIINENDQLDIGLAAPQLGINLRIFVTKIAAAPHRNDLVPDSLRIYINPELEFLSEDKNLFYEACSSLPRTLFGPVYRPRHIIVKAWDQAGLPFTLECDGLLARCILHEYDHLDGFLFTDRLENIRDLIDKEFLAEVKIKFPELKTNKNINIKRINYLV